MAVFAAVRISVGLDFATFLWSIDQRNLAFNALSTIFTAAQEAFGCLLPDAVPAVAPILQRCRDLLAVWCLEASAHTAGPDVDADADADADLDHPAQDQTTHVVPTPVRAPQLASLPLASLLSPRPNAGPSTHAMLGTEPYIAPSPYEVLGMLQERSEVVMPVDASGSVAPSSQQSSLLLPASANVAVTVSQVEVLMSVMPPVSECLEVNALRESVTVVPSLHELFHFYTEGTAASGVRRDGRNVVFGAESMDMKAFVSKSAAGGPTIPELDFRRLLHDFSVCPKLVSAHVRLPPVLFAHAAFIYRKL